MSCESTSHELEKVAATNGHTTDNLRDIVLSQEAKITALEAEARGPLLQQLANLSVQLRITKQREMHFSNELSVAQVPCQQQLRRLVVLVAAASDRQATKCLEVSRHDPRRCTGISWAFAL